MSPSIPLGCTSVLGLVLVFVSAGCSYRLDSLRTKSANEVERTAPSASEPANPDADLVVARAAVSEMPGKSSKNTSVPWENPRTGAHGTITPLASANTANGQICQDFLASYVRDGNASWLQGQACRATRGRWEVRKLKPLRKSEDRDRRSDVRERKK